jgi:hypothetical protein
MLRGLRCLLRMLAIPALCCSWLQAAELRSLVVPGTAIVIAVPLAWRTVEPADGTLIRVAKPDGGAGLAVSVAPLAPGQGPAGFAQAALAELQKMTYGFDLLDWDFNLTYGNRAWSRLHFRCVIGEIRWEQQVWLTADNGQSVTVACSALPADWSAWAPVFERCVAESAGSRPVLRP